MTLLAVRLQSQTDDQWRSLTVDAEDENIAAAIAHRKEMELVNFSLVPQPPVAPKRPDSTDVEVLARYLDVVDLYTREKEQFDATYGMAKTSDAALTELERTGHQVLKNGKVTGPTRRGKAHLHAHLQTKPYKVVSIEPIFPNVQQLVSGIKALQQDPDHWDRAIKYMKSQGIPLGVTGSLFGLQAQKQWDGSAPIVWSSGTMKVALTTSTFAPNNDTHDFFNDVTNEITGTGYTSGGFTLGTKTSTYDTATDQARLSAANVVQASSTFTTRIAVLWNDTAGASSTDPVVGWVDFITDQSPSNGTFQITWDATGIVIVDVT